MNAWTIIELFAGLAVLGVGADVLVRGASRLALSLGITPLVVGLTVVAYGTSAPEAAIGVQAALAGQADLAIGNVVGSNISNVLLILGISAVLSPIIVSQQLVRFDVPLMIGASVLSFGMAFDGTVSHVDGWILITGSVVYTVFAVWKSRRDQLAIGGAGVEENAPRPKRTGREIGLDALRIAAGIALLALGARWLVSGATSIARTFGISELIIGLTVVAVGTSLPELATSVVAAKHGEGDIAAGNVVGSNLSNLLFVLGLAAAFSPNGLSVTSHLLAFDIPVMVAVAIACLPIFFRGSRISRWEGALFLFYYVAYVGYITLKATEPTYATLVADVMSYFAIPLTVITIGVLIARDAASRRRT